MMERNGPGQRIDFAARTQANGVTPTMASANSNGKSNGQLERLHFDMGRAHEYLAVTELEMMAGRSRHEFLAVDIKESMDNGMDAAEKAGVAPIIKLTVERLDDAVRVTVRDNGCGITSNIVERLC